MVIRNLQSVRLKTSKYSKGQINIRVNQMKTKENLLEVKKYSPEVLNLGDFLSKTGELKAGRLHKKS